MNRPQQFDGTPPSVISAAMIREAFNLDDDAALMMTVQLPGTLRVISVEVTTLGVGKRVFGPALPEDAPLLGYYLG